MVVMFLVFDYYFINVEDVVVFDIDMFKVVEGEWMLMVEKVLYVVMFRVYLNYGVSIYMYQLVVSVVVFFYEILLWFVDMDWVGFGFYVVVIFYCFLGMIMLVKVFCKNLWLDINVYLMVSYGVICFVLDFQGGFGMI